MMRYQVRFHLGKGKHFGHWQVKSAVGVQYHNPATTSLTLLDCQLRNQPGTARKIHAGEHKKVCAWIDCNEVIVSGRLSVVGLPCKYNPKVAPNWRNRSGDNIDNQRVEVLRTEGREVLFTGERTENNGGLVRLADPAEEEHALGPMRRER